MKKADLYFDQTWNRLSLKFISKAFRFVILNISMSWIVPPRLRVELLGLCGVKFIDKSKVFVGQNVFFDIVDGVTTYVGKNVTVTTGSKILNHFYLPKEKKYQKGNVYIGDGVFIGMNTLVVKPVRIGRDAVIGAGSVVTKDIPEKALAVGIPARVIKRT